VGGGETITLKKLICICQISLPASETVTCLTAHGIADIEFEVLCSVVRS